MRSYIAISQVSLICFALSCVSPQGHKHSSSSKLIDGYEAFFNALPRVDGALDLSQLKALPGGGTHKIYAWESNSEFLMKIMISIGDHSRDELVAIKDEISEKYAKLYKVFGDVNCLIEHRFVAPVSEKREHPDKIVIVSIVKYEPAFHSLEKFGFNAEAIEPDRYLINDHISKYHNMNAYLIGNNAFTTTEFSFDDFFIFNTGWKEIFSRLDESSSLRSAMKDFLQKFRIYFVQTDEFMDFKGHDNVIFFKTGNQWDYRIGSVIKNVTGQKFVRALAQFNDDPEFINQSFENRVLITYVPSWIRSLNATGMKLGLGRVIDKISISKLDSTNLSQSFDALPFSSKMRIAMEHEDYDSAIKFFESYERSEEKHNSEIRRERTIQYWRNIKKKKPTHFGKEILVFLSMIADPRNVFASLSSNQRKETASIVLEMSDLASTKYNLDKKLKERIAALVHALTKSSE